MIKVENLVKKFGDVTAVDDVSFEVGSGEIFACSGPKRCRKNDDNQDADHAAKTDQRQNRDRRP